MLRQGNVHRVKGASSIEVEMTEPLFRALQDSDFESCARLAAQAWPVHAHLTSERDPWRFMAPYIDIAIGWSNWTEVICDPSGRVTGLMFGEIRGRDSVGRKKMGVGMKILTSEMKVHAKFVLGRYGRVERLPAVLRTFGTTELKLIINRPEADAEVNLFLVDAELRGMGLGRKLMDRFVDAARSRGAKRISVYADDHASNWEFYERYGFKRTGMFYDNWSSYYNRHDSYGIRLSLDLTRQEMRPPSAP